MSTPEFVPNDWLYDLSQWVREKPKKLVLILFSIVGVVAIGIYVYLLWIQDIHDYSQPVELNNEVTASVIYKVAVVPDSESAINFLMTPKLQAGSVYTVSVMLTEQTPDYAFLTTPFSKTYVITSSFAISDSAQYFVRNPPWEVNRVGFDLQLGIEQVPPLNIPIEVSIHRLHQNAPLVVAIFACLGFVITLFGQNVASWLNGVFANKT